MDREGVDKPTVVRVDDLDPLVCSCAVCGWTPQRPDPEDGLLPWSVIEHWLIEHWAGVESCMADKPGAAYEPDGRGDW